MKKILFIAALVGIALAGCKKNEKPELNVTPDELNFNYSAETKEVTVSICPQQGAGFSNYNCP